MVYNRCVQSLQESWLLRYGENLWFERLTCPLHSSEDSLQSSVVAHFSRKQQHHFLPLNTFKDDTGCPVMVPTAAKRCHFFSLTNNQHPTRTVCVLALQTQGPPCQSPLPELKKNVKPSLIYLFILFSSPLPSSRKYRRQLLNEDWWNKTGMSTISQVQLLCAHVRSAPPTVGMMMMTGAM